jgi:hypothetical protein
MTITCWRGHTLSACLQVVHIAGQRDPTRALRPPSSLRHECTLRGAYTPRWSQRLMSGHLGKTSPATLSGLPAVCPASSGSATIPKWLTTIEQSVDTGHPFDDRRIIIFCARFLQPLIGKKIWLSSAETIVIIIVSFQSLRPQVQLRLPRDSHPSVGRPGRLETLERSGTR